MPYYKSRAYRARRPYLRPSMPSRSKYSIEQKSFTASYGSTPVGGLYQTNVQLVDSVTMQGMRKVKHLTLSLTAVTTNTTDTDGCGPIYWAIVYVPQGTNVGALSLNNSLYEPNQYVMNCGVVDPSAGPIRFSSPVARNLNSGDAIYLVMGSTGTSGAPQLSGVVKYAITLN